MNYKKKLKLEQDMNKRTVGENNVFCNKDNCVFIMEQVHIMFDDNKFYKQQTEKVCTVTKDNYLDKMRSAVMSYANVQCQDEIKEGPVKNTANNFHNIYAIFNIYAKSTTSDGYDQDKHSQIDVMYPLPIFSTTNKKDLEKLFGEYETEQNIYYNLSCTGKPCQDMIEYDKELQFIIGSNQINKHNYHNYAIIFPDTFKN